MSRCFACDSPDVVGACPRCRVATYCSAECANSDFTKNHHGLSCSQRAASLLTAAPFGFPAYLDTPAEAIAFNRFVSARGRSITGANGAPYSPSEVSQLLKQIFSEGLTGEQRTSWSERAPLMNHASGLNLFQATRMLDVVADLTHTYNNDSRIKQIWRNLDSRDRSVYTGAPRDQPVVIDSDSDDAIVIDGPPVAGAALDAAYFTYAVRRRADAGDITQQLADAIMGNKSALTVISMTEAGSRTRGLAWELLFHRDFDDPARSTASGANFIREFNARRGQVPYNRLYDAACKKLATGMATSLVYAIQETIEDNRALFYINERSSLATLCYGTTYDATSGGDESAADNFDVRSADKADFFGDVDTNMSTIGAVDTARVEMQIVADLKTQNARTQRSAMVALESMLTDAQLARYRPYVINPCAKIVENRDAVHGHEYDTATIVEAANEACRNYAFGFDGKELRGYELVHELSAFFTKLFKRRSAQIDLVLVEVPAEAGLDDVGYLAAYGRPDPFKPYSTNTTHVSVDTNAAPEPCEILDWAREKVAYAYLTNFK